MANADWRDCEGTQEVLGNQPMCRPEVAAKIRCFPFWYGWSPISQPASLAQW